MTALRSPFAGDFSRGDAELLAAHLKALACPQRLRILAQLNTFGVIRCRRTEYRAAVDTEAMHWPVFAREFRKTADAGARAGVAALNSAAGALPMHWWVSLWPVPVVELEAFR